MRNPAAMNPTAQRARNGQPDDSYYSDDSDDSDDSDHFDDSYYSDDSDDSDDWMTPTSWILIQKTKIKDL